MKRFTGVFFGVIACILLLLYASTLGFMVCKVILWGRKDPSASHTFTTGVVLVVTTVGGLISALVISKLAIRKPDEDPGIVRMTLKDDGTQDPAITTLVIIYLGVWILTGLTALVVGAMIYPDVNQTLSDVGTTWLGLAVSAGYAYFNVERKKQAGSGAGQASTPPPPATT